MSNLRTEIGEGDGSVESASNEFEKKRDESDDPKYSKNGKNQERFFRYLSLKVYPAFI